MDIPAFIYFVSLFISLNKTIVPFAQSRRSIKLFYDQLLSSNLFLCVDASSHQEGQAFLWES
jgi:hypothetical protein